MAVRAFFRTKGDVKIEADIPGLSLTNRLHRDLREHLCANGCDR